MTREHKLALIFGFALVLVVGLLISDNFSASRKSEPGGPQVSEASQPILREDVLVAGGDTERPVITAAPTGGVFPEPAPTNPSLADPAPFNPTPVATNEPGGLTSPTGTQEPSTLTFGDRVQGAWNETIDDLRKGHVSTPEAAATDPVTPGNSINPALPAPKQPAPALPHGTGAGTGSNDSLFSPEPPAPAPVRGNGLNGAGSDLGGLGVKPQDLKPQGVDRAGKPTQEADAGKSSDRRHQIAEGDSFWKIASRYYNDGKLAEALKAYNKDRIGKNGQLRVGASLLIPEKSALTGKTAAKTERKPEKKSDLKVPNKDTVAKATPAEKPAKAEKSAKNPATYTVKKGDTLEKIAVRFLGSASRIDDLMRANRGTLDNEDDLRAGDVLKIPAR